MRRGKKCRQGSPSRQAMGCPRGRGEAAARYLAGYVEAMKASGFVAEALQRHGVTGAAVAPVG